MELYKAQKQGRVKTQDYHTTEKLWKRKTRRLLYIYIAHHCVGQQM